MTNEEAIQNNKNLREYMKINDKKSEYKFLEENYIALDMSNKALEQQPCKDRIRELIREFDDKHPAFVDYMEGFNEHTISEIIDYMWDMHCLIEDIKYRLPDEEGEEE